MKNFRRLTSGLPVQGLMQLLDANPAWWDEHTLRQSYPGGVHHSTKSIIFIGTKEKEIDRIFDDLETETYPRYEECEGELLNILLHLIQDVHIARGGRVLCEKLLGQSAINVHSDEGRYAETFCRLHIPLRTNDESRMVCGDEMVHMRVGEAWWFNHRIPHHAYNQGITDRIHLIVDCILEGV